MELRPTIIFIGPIDVQDLPQYGKLVHCAYPSLNIVSQNGIDPTLITGPKLVIGCLHRICVWSSFWNFNFSRAHLDEITMFSFFDLLAAIALCKETATLSSTGDLKQLGLITDTGTLTGADGGRWQYNEDESQLRLFLIN